MPHNAPRAQSCASATARGVPRRPIAGESCRPAAPPLQEGLPGAARSGWRCTPTPRVEEVACKRPAAEEVPDSAPHLGRDSVSYRHLRFHSDQRPRWARGRRSGPWKRGGQRRRGPGSCLCSMGGHGSVAETYRWRRRAAVRATWRQRQAAAAFCPWPAEGCRQSGEWPAVRRWAYPRSPTGAPAKVVLTQRSSVGRGDQRRCCPRTLRLPAGRRSEVVSKGSNPEWNHHIIAMGLRPTAWPERAAATSRPEQTSELKQQEADRQARPQAATPPSQVLLQVQSDSPCRRWGPRPTRARWAASEQNKAWPKGHGGDGSKAPRP